MIYKMSNLPINQTTELIDSSCNPYPLPQPEVKSALPIDDKAMYQTPIGNGPLPVETVNPSKPPDPNQPAPTAKPIPIIITPCQRPSVVPNIILGLMIVFGVYYFTKEN